ncbi:MAG: DNA phosphorothioation system sulfurtransferase DndC [Chloroflexi bacterium]|nr:DNA phosphorothioation system sulfurtransferase DndC [Chloroflexota bacterium]MYF64588.1 DNA phosphorothioation system sulfurtransferase DndC [Chloroflexota bacterium]MYK35498.1 DNA phosphorothioation system sulfurtransferase DndC [Chloroflexota bacterium]
MKTGIAERIRSIRGVIATEYLKRHSDPWIVAYSGGKDSTLLLQLVWEMLAELPPEKRRRVVYVVANDTLVESPMVIDHLRKSIAVIRETAKSAWLPIETHITKPAVDQTFWVNVIGRGYMPPTRNFRWCTDRMKILPTKRLIGRLLARHKRAILLVGTRKSESISRRRRMDGRGVKADTMNPHSRIEGCRMFAPLADLEDNDVWTVLIQSKPPWGGTHRDLITLYRNAGGGECPLVLTKADAPSCGTTSPRFGCWTCTVVQKDRSMRGTIDSGHMESDKLELLSDFREELMALREDDGNRMTVRRDGHSKSRADGSRVYGPFTMEMRRHILARLHELEAQIGEGLISDGEIEAIEDVWWRDETREEGRLALLERIA